MVILALHELWTFKLHIKLAINIQEDSILKRSKTLVKIYIHVFSYM